MAVAKNWRLAVTAIGLLATPAAAQQILSSSPFNVSAPTITPGLSQTLLDFDVVGLYDSNVARSDEKLAAERGLKPEDEIFEPGGNFLISRPIGRETLYLSGDLGYSAYVRNTVLDRLRAHAAGGAIGSLSVCTGNFAGAFSRVQEDQADLGLETKALTVKDVVQDVLVSLTATCGRSIGFAPTFSVSRTSINNGNTALGVTDADEFSGSGGIAYRSPVLGVLSLTGQYSKVNYPNRFIAGAAGLESLDFRTRGGGVSYTRVVGSRLQGSASLSYTDLQTDSTTARGFKGLTYAFDFSYAVNPLLNADVQIERQTSPSNRPDSSYTISEIYLLRLTYKLGARTNLSAGISRLHQDYEGVLIPILDDLTVQTTETVFGAANFKLTRRLKWGVTVQGQHRAANFPGLSYSDVQVSLTAGASF